MNSTLSSYLSSPQDTYSKSIKSNYLQKSADKIALNLFHNAAKSIPAYQDFLKQNQVKARLIKTISDYNNVPFISKENYISKYPLNSRCWQGKVSQTHTFSASSGSTGKPTFWPRQLEQEIDGAKIHELIFNKIFKFNHKTTLFINGFGLGNWIAGMYTHACAQLCQLHGLEFTNATPGYNQEEIFKVIKQFSPKYDQTIIAGHPPILKMLIETGYNQGIDWKQINLKILGAAEGFSENWRDYVLHLINQTDPLRSLINIYGSADAGLMAFETPLSIAIHRETATNHPLNQELYSSERNPYLYQFDPRFRYLQSIDSNITITMNATMPLIRYNIFDHGDIIHPSHAISAVKKYSKGFLTKLKQQKVDVTQWQLPYAYIFGRDQFMTTLNGVNIYPENIKAVIDHEELQPHLTGRFISKKKIDFQGDQFLQLRLELKPGKRESKKIKALAQKIFITTLKTINSEYNQVEQKYHHKMHPHLKFHRYHHPQFFPEGTTKKMG